VDALGAPHIGERSEAKLIADFIDKIGQLRPQLVTFNGHSFDLPVLRYRAMVNRVAAGDLQVRPYFNRYSDDALDLCDVLGSYVPGSKVKLDEVSKILGLTGKPEGVDGSRVEEMVLAGSPLKTLWPIDSNHRLRTVTQGKVPPQISTLERVE
jgi:3'-5' exonuclease